MRAKLKRMHSPDVDLESYRPEDRRNFAFLLQAMIGSDDTVEEESFDIFCTPKWLLENHGEDELIWGRRMLIAFDYDLPRIERKIVHYCERSTGRTWSEVAAKLSRVGHWEFEDYAP